MSSLIDDCRRAAKVLQEQGSFFTAQGLLEEAALEIERCHMRLEIDHAYRLCPKGGEELVRFEVPYTERIGTTDGIECRDTTIALLERDNKE